MGLVTIHQEIISELVRQFCTNHLD